jgi:hypothetical protein
MQVIGIARLYDLAQKRPGLGLPLRALAARLASVKALDAAELASILNGEVQGDKVQIDLAETGARVMARYDGEILMIVDALATGDTR